MDKEKESILYVDDEEDNLSVFASTFRRYNYHIFTAKSGDEALNIIRDNKIAVVISDQRMPQMTGIQLFESIVEEHPLPIRILMTGYSDVSAIINAINVGHIFRYITKPWEETELQQSIDVAVKIYQLERRNRAYLNQLHEESIKRERILNVFRRYIPYHVVNEVLKNNSMLNLFKGNQQHVCVLFAAIKNLDTFTRHAHPKDIFQYVNQYISLMSDCVNEHKGFIDKFVGNKILTIFGAPLSDINIEKNALYCAIDMIDKLKKFNADYEEKLGFKTEISVGINSGPAVVGNIGSQEYISYTAIGDTVNTASRIHDLTGSLSKQILISEPVYQSVKDNLTIEAMGLKQIRGKELPVSIYSVEHKRASNY